MDGMMDDGWMMAGWMDGWWIDGWMSQVVRCDPGLMLPAVTDFQSWHMGTGRSWLSFHINCCRQMKMIPAGRVWLIYTDDATVQDRESDKQQEAQRFI